jgi:hypothetical protein
MVVLIMTGMTGMTVNNVELIGSLGMHLLKSPRNQSTCEHIESDGMRAAVEVRRLHSRRRR